MSNPAPTTALSPSAAPTGNRSQEAPSSSRAVDFSDHNGFHRTALSMGVAGAMAGLAAHVLCLLEPRLGGMASPVPLAAVAGAAAYGAASSETRARARDLAIVVLGAAFAAAALSAVARGQMSLALGTALFAGSIGFLFARGYAGKRFWFAAAAGTSATLAAKFVLTQLAAAQFAPTWLVAAGAGASFGIVALLGTLPRHLRWMTRTRDGDEAQEILSRAREVAVRCESHEDPSLRETIRAEVVRLEEVAVRFADLNRQAAASPSASELDARVAELNRRIDSASDAMAKAQFVKARDVVEAQRAEVAAIDAGRERVLARMHHALATIERTRLAAVGAEIDCASQALLEAEEAHSEATSAASSAADPN